MQPDLSSLFRQPGGILEEIALHKLTEVNQARAAVPVTRLEESEVFDRSCYSMKQFMLAAGRTGIIAEFKRSSPSKGVINDSADVATVTKAYADAGASALSVLTDQKFFGGRIRDLIEARQVNEVPVLRKEFILDEYQIIEAKAIGADIVLLIAALLKPATVKRFASLAKSLGLNVLLEVHNLEELEESLCDDLDAVGVNNRNLVDFSVSLDHSYSLVDKIPPEFLKISESGISNPETILDLKKAGFNGFLVGENFMREADPGEAMLNFVKQLS